MTFIATVHIICCNPQMTPNYTVSSTAYKYAPSNDDLLVYNDHSATIQHRTAVYIASVYSS